MSDQFDSTNEDLANEDSEYRGRIPPGKLFISFMLVSGSYMLSLMVMFFSFVLLVMTSYPEVNKLIADPENIEAVFAINPEAVIPRSLFFSLLAIGIITSFALGWLVSRLAPFAKFAHAFFLAVLTGVTYLQQFMSVTQSARWMFLAFLIALPFAALAGGRIASNRVNNVQ